MRLEPDQAGSQSHSHPQCQAHPNRYNGCYYVPGSVNNWSIVITTNCVTDHTMGLSNKTLLLSSLSNWWNAFLTSLKFLHEDHEWFRSLRARIIILKPILTAKCMSSSCSVLFLASLLRLLSLLTEIKLEMSRLNVKQQFVSYWILTAMMSLKFYSFFYGMFVPCFHHCHPLYIFYHYWQRSRLNSQ